MQEKLEKNLSLKLYKKLFMKFFTGNNNDLVLSLNSAKNEDLSGELVGKK